jgi:hypothetical protein
MARVVDWTYELPPLAGDTVWLEGYLVYDRDGEPAGQVFVVLEHESRRWLGVERDHLPGRHDRRVVPFESVRETDHENFAVHLSLSAQEIDDALELDPDRGVKHGGTARRITLPPADELPLVHDADEPGPVDSMGNLGAPIAAVLGLLSLLAVFVFWGADRRSAALPFLAVPGVLFALAVLLGYRMWTRRWTRSARPQR